MASYVGVSTGIMVTPEALDTFRQMKYNHAFGYMTMKMNGKNACVVESTSLPVHYTFPATDTPSINPCEQVESSLSLPYEILVNVFSYLPTKDVLQAALVCKDFKDIISEHAQLIWHRVAVNYEITVPLVDPRPSPFPIERTGHSSWRDLVRQRHEERNRGNCLQTWRKFYSSLPMDECRFVIIRMLKRGELRSYFVLWAPDIASVRDRMIFASSTYPVKNALGVIEYEVQASTLVDLDDFARSEMRKWEL
eukprot:TRINITY_DN10182_c0_g1_i2.p1 TRINITY_DN10182_c0_g1~~TRINITY_DN10182_c0_g1_i2.p1  ORF type:complete len:251 (+),score=38.59 TRINITY_DN10182_c0_g1_i2:70-822(+)